MSERVRLRESEGMNALQEKPEGTLEAPATMRTLIGVDGEGLYRSAIDLVGRLRFAGNRATLAHVEAAVGFVGNPGPMVYDYRSASEIEGVLRTVGRGLLEEASDAARAAGLGDLPKTAYAVGGASATLLDLADKERADLVAIGSHGRGPTQSFFLGSVGRAFAIGAHQSFLIARGEPKTHGPVRAVFATDGSEYADRCFARLLDMDPQGLSHVTIVTATDPSKENELAAAIGCDDRTPYSVSEAEDCMRKHGAEMVSRLAAKGVGAEFRFAQGHPAEALREAMDETSSDLMILGARGHGLLERVFIGSLALHAVVAEPYSVLVLRMPQ